MLPTNRLFSHTISRQLWMLPLFGLTVVMQMVFTNWATRARYLGRSLTPGILASSWELISEEFLGNLYRQEFMVMTDFTIALSGPMAKIFAHWMAPTNMISCSRTPLKFGKSLSSASCIALAWIWWLEQDIILSQLLAGRIRTSELNLKGILLDQTGQLESLLCEAANRMNECLKVSFWGVKPNEWMPVRLNGLKSTLSPVRTP